MRREAITGLSSRRCGQIATSTLNPVSSSASDNVTWAEKFDRQSEIDALSAIHEVNREYEQDRQNRDLIEAIDKLRDRPVGMPPCAVDANGCE
jgi:hypothetical protein